MENKLYLKKYRVTLTTRGPLYIGSGQQLKKNDWIMSGEKGYVFDLRKLYLFLEKKNLLNKYEAFVIGEEAEKGKEKEKEKAQSLKDWLNVVLSAEELEELKCEATRYTFDCNGLKEDYQNDLQLFVKDGLGRPYVPGSSLKGAIRSILLSQKLQDEPSGRAEEVIINRANKKKLKETSRNLEKENFNIRNLQNNNLRQDIMAAVRISDSLPVDTDWLVICEKYDVYPDGGVPKKRSVNVLRECICPGTKIVFDLTIDESVFRDIPEDERIDIGMIERAIATFSENYQQYFTGKFKTVGKESIDKDTIFLGGGSGYHSKTVTIGLLKEKHEDKIIKVSADILHHSLSKEMQSKVKHAQDEKRYHVSPHMLKLTQYHDELYQLGMCRINFEEIKG
ncbi:MAG: type III-A CRISPR-associated RAMP protein Csm5 [Firmicutes bacterium]|nr:type III-A CRISPR-associated RAMP protein Csm5 [Bacillota bacterium]